MKRVSVVAGHLAAAPHDTKSLKHLVSAEEWAARCELACLYRACALLGYTDHVFTHLTVRLPNECFLINPFGTTFEEVTASSLLKVDAKGNVLLNPRNALMNQAGFVIHSAVHEARPEVYCVIHTHEPHTIAVGASGDLLPLSQQASIVISKGVGYHDYEGIALRDAEKPRLVASLGDSCYLMLRNHGCLTVGENVADAFIHMYALVSACKIQVLTMSIPGQKTFVGQEIIEGQREAALQVSHAKSQGGSVGMIAWPAMVRKVDRELPGYDQ